MERPTVPFAPNNTLRENAKGKERPSAVTACWQRAPVSGLKLNDSRRFRLGAGRQLICRVLFCLSGLRLAESQIGSGVA